MKIQENYNIGNEGLFLFMVGIAVVDGERMPDGRSLYY